MKPKPGPLKASLQSLVSPMMDWLKDHTIYKAQTLYRRYSEAVSRSYAFAKHGWGSQDYDATTIWPLLAFKLKRVYPVLVNGHGVQVEEQLNALLEAIAICERLGKEEHDSKYYELHEAKWGELEDKGFVEVPPYGEGKSVAYRWIMERPKVTPENKEQEKAELRLVLENGQKDKEADLDRLAFILKKYSEQWWD